MVRVAIGAGFALMLAGCGGLPGGGAADAPDQNVLHDLASNPKLSNPLAVSGGSNDCAKNPAFVPIYAGGKILVCSSAHFDDSGQDKGSFTYTTDAAPAAVLAFSKESAVKSGLKVMIESPAMLSVAEGDKRRFVAFPRAEGGTTKVTVNWTNTP